MDEKYLTVYFCDVKRNAIYYTGILLFAISTTLVCSSCSQQKYNTIKQIKPKTHNRYYNPQKDKHKKRTKTVRMKS